LGFYFGWLFGIQTGLIHFTGDHSGLNRDADLWESCLITLDNACHGIFLDTFELYNINLAGELQHSWVSATWFFAFRTAFDVLVVLFLFLLYQRWSLRHILAKYPHVLILSYRPLLRFNVEMLCGWIDQTCADKRGWMSRFTDEFLFLAMVSEYLKGNYAFVAETSWRFPWIKLRNEIHPLFVDNAGQSLITNTYQKDS
jgi:hypothetical protein